jgi:hypothetical protein
MEMDAIRMYFSDSPLSTRDISGMNETMSLGVSLKRAADRGGKMNVKIESAGEGIKIDKQRTNGELL